MKQKVKYFIVYFPVILVAFQVGVNLLSFLVPPWYNAAGFYLNTFFGTNMLFSVFLLCFTFLFKFCDVSRWAAVAEFLFGLNYLIIQQDNLYNILFQVIVGVIAIVITFRHYIKKFPLCTWSLFFDFMHKSMKEKSCKKGYETWDREMTGFIHSKNHRTNHAAKL